MQNFDGIVATLQHDCIIFKFKDGSEAVAPRDVVFNSKLLSELLRDFSAGESVALNVKRNMLQRWLSYVSHKSSFCVASLEAADYLCDEEHLESLCKQAADWLYEPYTPATPNIVSPQEDVILHTDRVEAISQLPDCLIVSVLAAASIPLGRQLKLLPEHLHMLVLHAVWPLQLTDFELRS